MTFVEPRIARLSYVVSCQVSPQLPLGEVFTIELGRDQIVAKARQSISASTVIPVTEYSAMKRLFTICTALAASMLATHTGAAAPPDYPAGTLAAYFDDAPASARGR